MTLAANVVWCHRHSHSPKMGFEQEKRCIFQATHTPLVILAIPKNIDGSSNPSKVTLIAVVTPLSSVTDIAMRPRWVDLGRLQPWVTNCRCFLALGFVNQPE